MNIKFAYLSYGVLEDTVTSYTNFKCYFFQKGACSHCSLLGHDDTV